MSDVPNIRTVSHEYWHNMPVAAYRSHIAMSQAAVDSGIFGNMTVTHAYSEHWSTPGEYEFPMRLYSEDDVRGLIELYQDEIAQLKQQLMLDNIA